jgi:phosphoribosyl-ATP pyrophosphohydrolase/phosphoribosyl-AMP cyclohydrolase
MSAKPTLDLNALNFDKGDGLVTVVAQDVRSNAVLMVAFANREALEKTLATGKMHYHSRSRGLWLKGETSGNVQTVVQLRPDCDGDTVLAQVIPAGPACHTGSDTCFGKAPAPDVLGALDGLIAERAVTPKGAKESYTQKLLGDRNLRLKKLGEECAELVLACADQDRARAAEEGADIVYHLLVALRALGVGLPEVTAVLDRRAKKS